MKRTVLVSLALLGGLLGCRQEVSPVSLYRSDVEFLRKYTDLVLLTDQAGQAQVAIAPAYQGRVMTSTVDSIRGMSYGWINRELIALQRWQPQFNPLGGEDRLWLGPEGGQFSIFFEKGEPFDLAHWDTPASLDTEPFNTDVSEPMRAAFSKKCEFRNYSGTVFQTEIRREVRLLSRAEVCSRLRLVDGAAPAPTPPVPTPATAPAPGVGAGAPGEELVQPNFGPAPARPATAPATAPALAPATAPKPVAPPAKPVAPPVPAAKPVAPPVPAVKPAEPAKPSKPVAPKPAPKPDPVYEAILSDQVQMVAYESHNKLTNLGSQAWTKDSGMLSIWILGMLVASPTNVVIAPYVPGPESELGPVVNDNYFVKVPPSRLKIGPSAVFFLADAKMRTKIGLSPRRARDVIGAYDAEHNLLTIVQYNKPPGTPDYVNSVWALQKEPFRGEVVNSYTDGPDGFKSNFYELETSSPAAGLQPKESILHIHRTIHFQGPREALDPIARRVLGVSLDEAVGAFK